MKDLKDIILEASLLGDIEKTLSDMDSGALGKLYPVPNINDFEKWLRNQQVLHWECPKLVQYYINEFTHPSARILFRDNKKPMGMCFVISKNRQISTYLYNTDKQLLELYGVGGVSNTMSEAKKAVIDCIKQILDNPDNLRKLIMFSNKHKKDVNVIEIYDTVSYNEIFK